MKSKKLERELKDCEAKQSLVDGFAVNEKFRKYTVDDLSTTQLRVALKVRRNKD
jgi:hypothetical protein